MTSSIVPDTQARGLLSRLPDTPRGLALLARFDRPIGWWLLFWPGAWAVALAGGGFVRWPLILWFLLGSIAMRGAGCVFNDIVDRDLDAKVARTASRPLASGWSEVAGTLTIAGLLLYAGTIFWVVGYDTIYALQDREDDALIGIGSSALSMGRHVRAGVSLCYALALALWATAIWQVRPDGLALVALLPMAGHLLWQVATLREDGVDPLTKFRANRFAGLLMFLACLVVGSA